MLSTEGCLKGITFSSNSVHQNRVYKIVTKVNYWLKVTPLWHQKKKKNEMKFHEVLPLAKTLLDCHEKVVAIILSVIVSMFLPHAWPCYK